MIRSLISNLRMRTPPNSMKIWMSTLQYSKTGSLVIRDTKELAQTYLALTDETEVQMIVDSLKTVRNHPKLKDDFKVKMTENKKQSSNQWFHTWLAKVMSEEDLKIFPLYLEEASSSVMIENKAKIAAFLFSNRSSTSNTSNEVQSPEKDLYMQASVVVDEVGNEINLKLMESLVRLIGVYSTELNPQRFLMDLSNHKTLNLYIDTLRPILEFLGVSISQPMEMLILQRKRHRELLLDNLKEELGHIVHLYQSRNYLAESGPFVPPPNTAPWMINESSENLNIKFNSSHIFEVPVQCFGTGSKNRFGFDALEVYDSVEDYLEGSSQSHKENDNVFENTAVPNDILKFASSSRKIIVQNLPDNSTEDSVRNSLRKCGNLEKVWIFKTKEEQELPEAKQDLILSNSVGLKSLGFEEMAKNSGLVASTKRKKKAGIKEKVLKSSKSDTYAFVLMEDDLSFENINRDAIRLFGISTKGPEEKGKPQKQLMSHIHPTHENKSFYVTINQLSSLRNTIDQINEMFQDNFRCYHIGPFADTVKPLYVRLHFDSHSDCWVAFHLLQSAINKANGNDKETAETPYTCCSWIRTRRYREFSSIHKDAERKLQDELSAIKLEVLNQQLLENIEEKGKINPKKRGTS